MKWHRIKARFFWPIMISLGTVVSTSIFWAGWGIVKATADNYVKEIILAENKIVVEEIQKLSTAVRSLDTQATGSRNQLFETQRDQDRLRQDVRQILNILLERANMGRVGPITEPLIPPATDN